MGKEHEERASSISTKTVKISNLSPRVTRADIVELFIYIGHIEFIEIWSDNEGSQGSHSQIALVTFKDSQSAETAVLISGAMVVDSSVAIALAPLDYQLPPAEIRVAPSVESDKVRELDQKFQVSRKTKSAFTAAEAKVSSVGSAMMKSPYVSPSDQHTKPAPTQGHRYITRHWQQPWFEYVKLNTDGCHKDGSAGCGGLIRDSDARFLCGFTKPLGAHPSDYAEVMGLLEDLKLAREMGCKKIMVEVDCEPLAGWMAGAKLRDYRYKYLVKECRDLVKKSDWTCVVFHVNRSCNRSAHSLTRYGMRFEYLVKYFTPPSNVDFHKALAHDRASNVDFHKALAHDRARLQKGGEKRRNDCP